AVELVQQGESPGDVAHFLGCGRSSVSTWMKLARPAPETLAAKPHVGPKPRLSAEHFRELEPWLLRGAPGHGWPNVWWACDRPAEWIQRHSRFRFHPEHVRQMLKRRLKWTSQKPQRRARERDEAAIDH